MRNFDGWWRDFSEDYLINPHRPHEKVAKFILDWFLLIPWVYGLYPILAMYFVGNWLGLGFGVLSWTARLLIGIVVWLPSIAIVLSLSFQTVGENGAFGPDDPD